MNKLMTAVLLFALAGAAAAQQKETPKKAAPAKPAAAAPAKPPARPAEKPAAQAAKAPKADPAADALARLKEWDEKLQSLKASFTQEVNFKEAGLKQHIEGTLAYSKPDLLRIEHLKPAAQLVVTDKKDIWVHKPADNQAVRTSWEAWRRTQDQNFAGLLDFGNYASLAARNNAVLGGGTEGKPLVLTFTPKSGAAYSLSLTLDAEYFPTGAELTVDGTVISTRLSAVERNAEVAPELFKFAPPKGTEVLQFKD